MICCYWIPSTYCFVFLFLKLGSRYWGRELCSMYRKLQTQRCCAHSSMQVCIVYDKKKLWSEPFFFFFNCSQFLVFFCFFFVFYFLFTKGIGWQYFKYQSSSEAAEGYNQRSTCTTIIEESGGWWPLILGAYHYARKVNARKACYDVCIQCCSCPPLATLRTKRSKTTDRSALCSALQPTVGWYWVTGMQN